MKAICTDSKNFELFENKKQLGRLTYKNWFSGLTEIETDNAHTYEIKPAGLFGLFGAAFTLSKNNAEVAIFKLNIQGHMILSFKGEQDFVLKKRAMFNTKYIIENTTGKEIIRLMPSFDWNGLKYSYDITHESKPDILLILTGMYCANYSIAMSGGAIIPTA
jgi:hypothetical protein